MSFNTSHVVVYLYRMSYRESEMEVSIHLML